MKKRILTQLFIIFPLVHSTLIKAESMKNIFFTLNENEVVISLDDNLSSNDLIELLPLQLNWEDYGEVEKIAYLPRKLNTKSTPPGYKPKQGDFAYYAPWGNLVIFCKDFRYSPGLIKLGTVSSGFDISCQKGKYSAEIKSE
ncbi:cyclophilin-like fold protein [Vibrio parahaemolyticus]|uniref:cyclophilin-like fold protein n=1 Tax=Vibrio parahaemolyticus TaxID=670 RepID=UPI0011232D8B|nr:cyclophilin-like fold protein [Vibrio parahaemolyticus]TOP86015.1 hypothetical protein CGH07_23855 [Vibrio parahaemolyticus]